MTQGVVRVLSWNIHKGVGGWDRRYDFARTLGVLSALRPDIALLQEVAFGMPRLRHHRQCDLLTSALGFHGLFHAEHHFRRGGYGNLILSRWPLEASSHLDLTVGRRKCRGALLSVVRLASGVALGVVNLHLGLGTRERDRQLRRLFTHELFVQRGMPLPVVLGGDFNDVWGNLAARHMQPAGFERAGRPWLTFPSMMPLRPLDGLYCRGPITPRHLRVGRSQQARLASDHLPLVADFTLR